MDVNKDGQIDFNELKNGFSTNNPEIKKIAQKLNISHD
jgi:hypothetical protein